MEENGKANAIRNWTVINSMLTGFSVAIITLILNWDNINGDDIWYYGPISLLFIAIVLFLNATFINSKILGNFKQMVEIDFLKKTGILRKWILLAEWSFGLGFTMLFSSVAIITYKHLDNLIPSFALMLSNWIAMGVYKFQNDEFMKVLGPKRKYPKIWKGWHYKKSAYFLIELIVIILIFLDYMMNHEIITIK